MLRQRLDAIATPRCAVAGLKVRGTVWVAPDLRAEIAYCGVTTAGELRHASFKGLVKLTESRPRDEGTRKGRTWIGSRG